ncbi:tyrosine-type recombinase/integrase [Prevotella intermedia]|nr:phage integrase SAM-like domain-containing protein [Prevotella intermedia]
MVKLTKSMPIVKERTCTASMVLDTRTNRKNVSEFPLAIRFTIDRKLFYLQIGGSYTEKKFSDICNAAKSASDNYRIQKEWRDAYASKYKVLLESLNRGGILTYEMVRQAVVNGITNITTSFGNNDKSQTFIGIWEEIIHELRTKDGGARFTTAESYEFSLKSFKKILGENAIQGFNISAAEIQKWKDGMHDGVVSKRGTIEGKISDTTAGIYLRCCRAVWNRCVREGYLKDVPYPFSNRKEKGLVSIPKSAKRRQSFLNVEQMTELYNLFISKSYPEHWSKEYTQRAHYSLGLFLAQYLCNGFNMADAGRLTYNDYYYQTGGKAFRFNRKKTAGRSADGSEVIIPIVPPLKRILDEIAATPNRDGFVFPDILKGAETEEIRRKYTSQENSNVKDRMEKICHEALHWDKSISPSGTWCRHSFATNLHNAGVDMDYISESMGHSTTDHAITQVYIEHYPLEIQMENNMKLLKLSGKTSTRETLLAKLASLSTAELAKLLA